MRAPRDFRPNYDNTIIYRPNGNKNKLLVLLERLLLK